MDVKFLLRVPMNAVELCTGQWDPVHFVDVAVREGKASRAVIRDAIVSALKKSNASNPDEVLAKFDGASIALIAEFVYHEATPYNVRVDEVEPIKNGNTTITFAVPCRLRFSDFLLAAEYRRKIA